VILLLCTLLFLQKEASELFSSISFTRMFFFLGNRNRFGLGMKNELLDLLWWISWMSHYTTLISTEIKSLQKGENISLNAQLLLTLFPSGDRGKNCKALLRAREQRLTLCSSPIQVLCFSSLFISNPNSQMPIWLPNKL